MSHDERFDQNIFHDIDHGKCRRQLDGLYGQVARDQNITILGKVSGPRVLDVGAGYGTLVRQLQDAGHDVVGIEPNESKIGYAKEWYGVGLKPLDIYETGFGDKQFDTVILREVVFHLDFNRALKEIDRICGKEVILFQGNDSFLRRLGQKVYGHHEFNEKNRNYYEAVLKENGYEIEKVGFRDVIAFPLSGGYIGRQLIPRWPVLYPLIRWVDRITTALLRLTALDRVFCLRFILKATRFN